MQERKFEIHYLYSSKDEPISEQSKDNITMKGRHIHHMFNTDIIIDFTMISEENIR